MFRIDAQKAVEFYDGMTRRDFLHAGALGTMGLTLPGFIGRQKAGAVTKGEEMNCIFLFLVGGPSQLDTFDMKPDAPAEIRGPYKPIKTNSSDIQISEIFPKLAHHTDKFSVIRTLHHTAAGVHDTGHQMMQTGHLFQNGMEHPHAGCVMGYLRGPRGVMPPHVLMPGPMGNTGGNMPHGQSAGFLGKSFDPYILNDEPEKAREAFDLSSEPDELKLAYGKNKFGQSCLLARRLVERGVRFVTVNMFETVFNEITWDIHGSAPFSPIECYSDLVGPMLDHGLSSLLEDLKQRGLLETTMVVATGEFGRTPKINPAGGRDHWTHAWPALLAGGGIQGGRVVGKTDAIGAYPVERPVTPAELVATLYHGLGIDLETTLPGPGHERIPLLPPGTRPIMELF
jgi:hypothetical protein